MSKYTAKDLKNWETSTPDNKGNWVPSRPMNHQLDPILYRIKLAWRVLIGKYDALDWQEEKYKGAKA